MNYIAGHVLLMLDSELLESIGIEKQYIGDTIVNLTKQKLNETNESL